MLFSQIVENTDFYIFVLPSHSFSFIFLPFLSIPTFPFFFLISLPFPPAFFFLPLLHSSFLFPRSFLAIFFRNMKCMILGTRATCIIIPCSKNWSRSRLILTSILICCILAERESSISGNDLRQHHNISRPCFKNTTLLPGFFWEVSKTQCFCYVFFCKLLFCSIRIERELNFREWPLQKPQHLATMF